MILNERYIISLICPTVHMYNFVVAILYLFICHLIHYCFKKKSHVDYYRQFNISCNFFHKRLEFVKKYSLVHLYASVMLNDIYINVIYIKFIMKNMLSLLKPPSIYPSLLLKYAGKL